MYLSLIYNNNTATSVTSQGRALTSSATMLFESFLGNNVKFGSLNEVIEFINHIVKEKPNRRFNDFEWLDPNGFATAEEVFYKLVVNCGFHWAPTNRELKILWRVVNNLNQEDLNRVFYKNHLYAFLDNSRVFALVEKMLKELNRPFLVVTDVPANIKDDLILFKDLLKEYVYYGYMYIDRIDRTQHMIRSIVMVSDTDSTIISLDAWYRYVSNRVAGKKFRIMNDYNEFITDGAEFRNPIEWIYDPIQFAEKEYDYDFQTDQIIADWVYKRPNDMSGYENIRNTLVSIISFVLDDLINDYMIKFCKNVNSITENRPEKVCRILMKNEFFGL